MRQSHMFANNEVQYNTTYIFGLPLPTLLLLSLPVPSAPRSSLVGSVFDVSAFNDTCHHHPSAMPKIRESTLQQLSV